MAQSVAHQVSRLDGGAHPTHWPEFEALLRARHADLRLLVYRLLEERDETEDVLQDSYAKAFQAWPRFRAGEGSVDGWLYRIVYRTCLDRLRARARRQTLALDLATEQRSSQPDPADDAIAHLTLAAALARLDPDARAALVLVDAIGFDYSTAAQVLDVPRGTIASRLHGARAFIREVVNGV